MTLFEQHHLPCLLESRLSKRYQTIVMEHMTVNSTNAPGAKSLEHHMQSWASTQATWRFYHNDNVTFPMLSSPMNGLAKSGVKETQSRYVLMAHDQFLADLASILPSNTTPLVVSDTGFKVPWYKSVKKLGWYWSSKRESAICRTKGGKLTTYQQLT